MKYSVIQQNFNIDSTTGLRSDKTIVLTVAKSKKLYPERLRLVEYYDRGNDNLLVFMTNNFDVSALEVANLYKNRWQIEVFFRWLKQNLMVKKFWGYSQNAIKTHLWMAVCTHLLVAYIKQMVKSPLTTYELMQILGAALFDKTSIRELLAENNNLQIKKNQNVKELLFLFS
jgi:hypothetical protein